ncbi:unnamed protein product [Darwinula stevensoni]|uniref:Uncharacterized protein n=1 Tax=Darwinula stevensoni TaxID=69355 RepID=A0A7R9AF22_9CRUS|nr:unnamed protein product [Darwinula stevensoni]CAG0902569.1 unnamed protein product [Darwinula stevensoni]
MCDEFSYLGRMRNYGERGPFDIKNNLNIYLGADDERPLKIVIGEYVAQNYPEAGNKAYSLPEGYILREKLIRELEETAYKNEADETCKEEVDMPSKHQSIAKVFDCLKYAFEGLPSLTIADYTFTDTLLKVMNDHQKDEFLDVSGVRKEYLESGAHDVFGIAISGKDIVGMFFQIEETTSNENQMTFFQMFKRATQKVLEDINIFRTLCNEFPLSSVKLAGFVAFPMLSETDMQEVVKCKECRERMLTSEDLKTKERFIGFLARNDIKLEIPSELGPESYLMTTFKDIFSLYVCAASAVDLPRNPTQLYTRTEQHMKPMLVILTPRQRELVKSNAKVILMTGTSGTGKTFVLKRRALELVEKSDPVMVLNLSGGDLTEDFRQDFQEAKKEIEVVDGREGRENGLEEDYEGMKKFLKKEGRGKHVLVDEVPITLGFLDIITTKALSEHWKWINELDVKSITLCFRPNDQSYTRNFPIEEVKPAGHDITVLNSVKRNTKHISELFLAIGNYSRRVFVSSEPSLRIDSEETGGECLPRFIEMWSCQALHRKCKDEAICESVRASHPTHVIYEECRKASEKMPVFVVLDSKSRRCAFVKVFSFLHDKVPVIYLRKFGEFRGKLTSDDSFPLVIVTEEEMMGCHPLNVTVILDFPGSKWKNYNRLIVSTSERKIVVVDEEEWRMGKFSKVPKEIKGKPGWKIEKRRGDAEDLRENLEKTWQKYKGTNLARLGERIFTILPFPEMKFDRDRKKDEDADVTKMLGCTFSVIIGYPASGKSRKLDALIERVTGQVLLLHSGGELSHEVYRQRWKEENNVDVVDARQINSLQDIFKKVEERLREKKEKEKVEKGKKKVKGRKKMGEEYMKEKEVKEEKAVLDSLVVVVEDCPFFNEFPDNTAERLKEKRVKLILSFKPHSANASEISVDRVIEKLKKWQDSTVVVVRSQLTDLLLMRHIRENETSTGLDLDSKNLSVSALAASIVCGPGVQYIQIKAQKCSGRHLGYTCRGENKCGTTANALLSFVQKDTFESTPYILVSEEVLLQPLQEKLRNIGNQFPVKHLNDFRGCETSVVISFNVNDDWLLEVFSRSRTRLVIIDNLVKHRDLWKQMKKEGRVEAISCTTEHEDDLSTLLRIDDQEMFLLHPTWDEVGIRTGMAAVKRGNVLDRNTGAIRLISPETIGAIDEELLQSSPFSDWGYAWNGKRKSSGLGEV